MGYVHRKVACGDFFRHTRLFAGVFDHPCKRVGKGSDLVFGLRLKIHVHLTQRQPVRGLHHIVYRLADDTGNKDSEYDGYQYA